MPQDKIVFVLWADRFDETLAALFVAEMRKAGLRVKIVSLAVQPSSGAYGVALVPDLTLEQALPLARYASAVIIPCGTSGLSRLQNDPRMIEFLVQVAQSGAAFIICQSGVVDLEHLTWPLSERPEPLVFSDSEEVLETIRQMAA